MRGCLKRELRRFDQIRSNEVSQTEMIKRKSKNDIYLDS